MARVLEKNPKFIRESIYAEQLDGQARKILRGYAVGRLLVPGDNRFLSGDLLELLRQQLMKWFAPIWEKTLLYRKEQNLYLKITKRVNDPS